MIEFSKIVTLKILILLLLTVKMNFVLNDSFSEATIEQYINNCSDEMEIEVESEISFFQKITKKTTVIFTKTSDVKAPVFKNTFSHKIHPIEFTTPPPEFIL